LWDSKVVGIKIDHLLLAVGIAVAAITTIFSTTAFSQSTDNFTFTAVGDWGCTSNTNAMASEMNTKNPEVVLGIGDYSYEPTMGCWHDIISQYPTIHDNLHVSLGNHEDDLCGDCSAGTNLNSTGRAEFLAHFNLSSSTFYSFDYKRVHFIALDTESDSPQQLNFAKNDLAAAGNSPDIDWIVAYMHHPLYTSCIQTCGYGGGNHTTFRDLYQPVLDKYVDLVLYGHYHDYERMMPMTYKVRRHMKYLVVNVIAPGGTHND